jgi:hypothetical protein
VLTIDAVYSMGPGDAEMLEPGAPRRNRAISEAIGLASMVGCYVNLLYTGQAYRVGPTDTLQSVLERYNEGPGTPVYRSHDPQSAASGVVAVISSRAAGKQWIGENAAGYKGESKPIYGSSGLRGEP